jgi:hypothetical protein
MNTSYWGFYLFGVFFAIAVAAALYIQFLLGKRSRLVPHCELSDEEAQQLIKDLRNRMAWHKVYKDTAMVELTARELALLIDCIEERHGRQRD